MYTYRKVQVEATRVASVTCNKCGRVVQLGEFDFQVEVSFTEIKNVYGYGSPKDGDKYLSHVCEACMDEFYTGFSIPPQIVGMVVWGEEPADPIVLVDESSDIKAV